MYREIMRWLITNIDRLETGQFDFEFEERRNHCKFYDRSDENRTSITFDEFSFKNSNKLTFQLN